MLHLVPFPVGKYKADRHRHGNQTCKESVKLRWLPDRQTDRHGGQWAIKHVARVVNNTRASVALLPVSHLFTF